MWRGGIPVLSCRHSPLLNQAPTSYPSPLLPTHTYSTSYYIIMLSNPSNFPFMLQLFEKGNKGNCTACQQSSKFMFRQPYTATVPSPPPPPPTAFPHPFLPSPNGTALVEKFETGEESGRRLFYRKSGGRGGRRCR